MSVWAVIQFGLALLSPAGDPPPKPPAPPTPNVALASWYAEHGTGACGVGDVQSGYRFASLFLSCGTRIRFRHGASTVTATRADAGPFISGRTFDLNANLRNALNCPDLCTVKWGYVK